MEKIMIIDDSPVQAAHLKNILESDYQITTVQEPQMGLNYAREQDFSLILLDVVMPGMDGFVLLKKLQEEVATRHIPVILITALSDIENEQRGLTLGAVDYIYSLSTR
ncbi:response regulator [Acutalibacter muris]|uniref:response regulator n=1 Tax=Acutalibacter muris TaxID=1796620 RepID=UPI002F3E276D